MKTNYFRQTAVALVIAAATFASCNRDDPAADPVKVTGISLDKSVLTLTVGGTATLVATVAPDDAANKEVTWSTVPLDVAFIGDNGEVIALKPGTAIITVTIEDGGFKDECAVTVNAKPE